MKVKLFILLIFTTHFKHVVHLAIGDRKYADQKDISERCKRRVAPSIFLGKQVVDANSHVMQFSRLEVPYSCSFSVRAEIGYNIIMIIHLLSSKSLKEACSQNPNQLIVYELGETFGGYWGHMPDVMMESTKKNYTKFYTIKTTKPFTTTKTQRTRTYKEEEYKKILVQTIPATDKEPDYIRMEVPLVNVSGNLQLRDPLRHTYNSEEMFDFIFDVTPKNGSEYETSIMPLVQFSIRQQKSDNDIKPRYELDYNLKDFTVDPRLIYSTKRRMNTLKSNWMANRRYNLKKKIKIPHVRINNAVTYNKLFTSWPHFTDSTLRTTTKPTLDGFYLTLPLKDLESSFNVTAPSTVIENITLRNILNNIAETQHSLSSYLVSNISIFDDITTTYHDDLKENLSGSSDSMFATKFIQALSTRKIYKFESNLLSSFYGVPKNNTVNIEDNINRNILAIQSKNMSQSNNEFNSEESPNETRKMLKFDVTNINILTATTRNDHDLFPNGTLVNHESWENVVQSAHAMAKILNRTELNSTKLNIETVGNKKAMSQQNIKIREKRFVKSLDIEKSRPRNLTTKQYIVTETEKINLLDIQYLARLVELQDDEIGGRVALRYLRNYVSGALFNICDYNEAQSKQMFLFNASRVVIAVSNMTLDHMMVVLTPAFPLYGNLSRCPPEHLECQIVGSRVCIDSLNACNGIPNCGSYDIYDEDRRLCGVAKGLPHNVYIAAFSFLALLLTLLYTIFYWLKRCVPRVSEAFFIFSDTSQNKLQLDTIMRSPLDADDFSDKFVYPGNFFDDVSLQDYKEQGKKSNILTRICNAYCGFLLCLKKNKQKPTEENKIEDYALKVRPSKMYSFTELELRKYAARTAQDVGVQTGDSIDIRLNKNIYNCKTTALDSLTKLKMNKHYVNDLKSSDELSLIKFTKETKSKQNDINTKGETVQSIRRHMFHEDEEEIKNTIYVRSSDILLKTTPVTCEIDQEKVNKASTSKHLRFDSSPTLIETKSYVEDITEASIERDSFSRGNEHPNKHRLETISEEDTRDNTRFWKFMNKKQKRKKNNSPH